MRNAHAVAEIRAAEAALLAQLPEGALMQRAAVGLAAAAARLLRSVYGSRVAVLAGSGDNGGDALHAGALLARRGAVVTAIAAAARVHEDGLAALLSAGGRFIDGTAATAGQPSAGPAGPGAGLARAGPPGAAAQDAIAAADMIIDGLLGIGGRGGLREPAASLAAAAGRARGVVVAADLPSGIDADTGAVPGAAVRADATITFGTWKPGLLIDPGASLAGATQLVDIGLGPYLGPAAAAALQDPDVAARLPRPSAESDKYRRGVLGVLAGSDRYPGAAMLALGGAIRGGAGMVRLVTAEAAAVAARQHWPEALITVADPDSPARSVEAAGRVQAWVAGPGMGTGEQSAGLLAAVLATSLPVLVDADGLSVLAAHPDLLPRAAPTLITPHAGELARLLRADRDDIEARRLQYARAAAAELRVTVLLKGSTTVVAGPAAAEPALANPTGTSWLATAGSGDVLSGLAGAFLAQGLEPALAAACAAYVHGLAGRLAADGAPIGASDLISKLPEAIRSIAGAGPHRHI